MTDIHGFQDKWNSLKKINLTSHFRPLNCQFILIFFERNGELHVSQSLPCGVVVPKLPDSRAKIARLILNSTQSVKAAQFSITINPIFKSSGVQHFELFKLRIFISKYRDAIVGFSIQILHCLDDLIRAPELAAAASLLEVGARKAEDTLSMHLKHYTIQFVSKFALRTLSGILEYRSALLRKFVPLNGPPCFCIVPEFIDFRVGFFHGQTLKAF